MKTDDLIAALSADALPAPRVESRLSRAVPAALGLSGLVFVLFWGLRGDLAQTLASAAVFKTVIPALLALCAAALALRLAHPAMPALGPGAAVGVVTLACGVLFAVALGQSGVAGLRQALATPSLFVCLGSIPILALPLMAGCLWALSAGASLNPSGTGAVAGLLSGGAAATIYSLYCDKDMVLFAVPAYGTAIALVTVIGAVAGARVLRW
jgi:hypothetical protein